MYLLMKPMAILWVFKLRITLAVLWVVTIVNAIGVKQAGIVQLLTTILKLIPLIIIAAVGLFYVKAENLMQFNVSGESHISALTAAATLTMWSFVGFESATVPADNVIEPKKNIPRATILGTAIAAIVYIFATTTVMGVVPMKELAASTSPFATASKIMFGSWGGLLVGAAGAIACFGTLNGWVLMQAQVPLAAARDGLFPKVFTRVSKNGTPVFGLVFSSILISIMLILQFGVNLVTLFTHIILLATLASLIPYLFCAIAELLLLVKNPEKFEAKRLKSVAVLATLGFVYAFWAIIGSGQATLSYGMLLFLSGIPLYVWLQYKKGEIAIK